MEGPQLWSFEGIILLWHSKSFNLLYNAYSKQSHIFLQILIFLPCGDLHQVLDNLGIIHVNFAIKPKSENCLLMIKYNFCWLCD
jgi:hypothetical protein